MLRITAGQFAEFEGRALAAQVPEFAAHLRQSFAEHLDRNGMGAGLEDQLFAGLKRASAHGLTNEGDLRLFAEAMAMLGPEFDRRLDWAQRILGDARLNSYEKTTLLHNHLIFAGA